ncbi:hypothetical protein ACWCW7_17695 [Nocardia tengchongensis]
MPEPIRHFLDYADTDSPLTGREAHDQAIVSGVHGVFDQRVLGAVALAAALTRQYPDLSGRPQQVVFPWGRSEPAVSLDAVYGIGSFWDGLQAGIRVNADNYDAAFRKERNPFSGNDGADRSLSTDRASGASWIGRSSIGLTEPGLLTDLNGEPALDFAVNKMIGRGYSDGGLVTGPGTATSDAIPAWLSDGEFVVNAAAADRNMPLLEALNAGRVHSVNHLQGTASTGLSGGSGVLNVPRTAPAGRAADAYQKSVQSWTPRSESRAVDNSLHIGNVNTGVSTEELRRELAMLQSERALSFVGR